MKSNTPINLFVRQRGTFACKAEMGMLLDLATHISNNGSKHTPKEILEYLAGEWCAGLMKEMQSVFGPEIVDNMFNTIWRRKNEDINIDSCSIDDAGHLSTATEDDAEHEE